MNVCQAPDCDETFEVPLKGRKLWCSELCRRRTVYGDTCKSCGARTDGSRGPGRAPEYCNRCMNRVLKGKWDRDSIIAAIQAWVETHGETPSAGEWQKAQHPVHPTVSTVAKYFGTWNAGIEAAGFKSRRVGRKRNDPPESVIAARPRKRKYHSRAHPRIKAKPPKRLPATSEDALRYGRPATGVSRRRLLLTEDDDMSHSTNTPAENRARVATLQAQEGRGKPYHTSRAGG